MGNEEKCYKRQDTIPDMGYLNPEQNNQINSNQKNNESFYDNQEELNIIDHMQSNKNNKNIDQTKTNSLIIQNDEFMYERINTKKKN